MAIKSTNGIPLAYDAAGDGAPVLLIHGSWGERQSWGFVLSGLAQSFHVVRYDRRGHGESAGRPEAGTVHDDVADAAALIEALGIAPAHVVASSYGGCIALRLASAHPELVARLVCHEPPLLGLLEASADGKPVAEEQWRKLEQVRERLERGDHAGGAAYFVEEVALGPGMWAQLPPPVKEMFVRHAPTFLGELRDPDALRPDLDALKQLAAPVLLTQGDRSPAMFRPLMDLLAGILPDARRHTISGAGHVPHMTHPDDYAAAIGRFLLEQQA